MYRAEDSNARNSVPATEHTDITNTGSHALTENGAFFVRRQMTLTRRAMELFPGFARSASGRRYQAARRGLRGGAGFGGCSTTIGERTSGRVCPSLTRS